MPEQLNTFFREHPRAALAFSGGTDSSFLLWAARAAGADVRAYFVKTEFQPAFELEDAKRLAAQLQADLRVLEASALEDPAVAANPVNRCYYCKKNVFGRIAAAAAEDGYDLILDGTNASDDAGDRPGMKALAELSVRSPLRECGLTKAEIRRLSEEAGLFTWNKPAYACLATRFPAGTPITAEGLARTETAEAYLFSLGFTDFRVRLFGGAARLQLPEEQLPALLAHREAVLAELKKSYGAVLLDLEPRKKAADL